MRYQKKIYRIFDEFFSLSRKTGLRLRGAKIGHKTLIGNDCRIILGHKGLIEIGDQAELQHAVLLHAYNGKIDIGRGTFLGPFVSIYGHGGVHIGDQCLIAMHCRVLSSNHTVPSMGISIRSRPDILLPTFIGNDVWLGAGVTVLGGVSIGDGCVVGAGAVVTSDLPPGSIAMGVPATIRSMRASS